MVYFFQKRTYCAGSVITSTWHVCFLVIVLSAAALVLRMLRWWNPTSLLSDGVLLAQQTCHFLDSKSNPISFLGCAPWYWHVPYSTWAWRRLRQLSTGKIITYAVQVWLYHLFMLPYLLLTPTTLLKRNALDSWTLPFNFAHQILWCQTPDFIWFHCSKQVSWERRAKVTSTFTVNEDGLVDSETDTSQHPMCVYLSLFVYLICIIYLYIVYIII